MGFGVNQPRGKISPVLNVTPLVDVVLVLLIIFMVVTPLLSKQLWLNVPPKVEDQEPPSDAPPPIVVTVDQQGLTFVNGERIAAEDLARRLVRMVNARADKVVFFDAHEALAFGQALEVMDAVRGGGIETLAVLAEPAPQSTQ